MQNFHFSQRTKSTPEELFLREWKITPFTIPLTIKSFSETTEKRDYPDLSSSKNPYFSKKFYIIH